MTWEGLRDRVGEHLEQAGISAGEDCQRIEVVYDGGTLLIDVEVDDKTQFCLSKEV